VVDSQVNQMTLNDQGKYFEEPLAAQLEIKRDEARSHGSYYGKRWSSNYSAML
jgi:hypothetical protein